MRTYLGQDRGQEEARVRSRRGKAVGGSCKKFGEVNRSAESTKTRERRLGGVASTIGSSVNYLRIGNSTSAAILPLFGDGCSSARAWVGAKIGVGEFGEAVAPI